MDSIKIFRLLSVITVLTSVCRAQFDICESYVPISYTGSGTEDSIFSVTAYRLEVKTITAHFYTYVDSDGNSYSDALVGLEFFATHTWGSNCAECSWSFAGNNIASTTKSETVTIPNNGNDYILSWEQSTSSDGKVLMGVTITTDTSTLLLGEIGPIK